MIGPARAAPICSRPGCGHLLRSYWLAVWTEPPAAAVAAEADLSPLRLCEACRQELWDVPPVAPRGTARRYRVYSKTAQWRKNQQAKAKAKAKGN